MGASMKMIALAFQILALLLAPLIAQTPGATVQVTATAPAVGNGAPVALIQYA